MERVYCSKTILPSLIQLIYSHTYYKLKKNPHLTCFALLTHTPLLSRKAHICKKANEKIQVFFFFFFPISRSTLYVAAFFFFLGLAQGICFGAGKEYVAARKFFFCWHREFVLVQYFVGAVNLFWRRKLFLVKERDK